MGVLGASSIYFPRLLILSWLVKVPRAFDLFDLCQLFGQFFLLLSEFLAEVVLLRFSRLFLCLLRLWILLAAFVVGIGVRFLLGIAPVIAPPHSGLLRFP